MNIYEINRCFWDFAFNNPDKIKPNHCAIYFFAIEHCNRLGWKKKFGFPTSMVLEDTGIKSYSVFKKTFDELVEYGFIEVIQYSRNQYSSNIIALKENNKALDKALDKALIKHTTKQRESIDSIDKQYNNKQITIELYPTFEDFWKLYDNKKGREYCVKKWNTLTQKEKEDIMEYLPAYIKSTPDKQFRKNPKTFLNNNSWHDEITTNKSESNIISEIGQQQALNFLFNK